MLQHVLFGIAVALAWFGFMNLCAMACFYAAGPFAGRLARVPGPWALGLRLAPVWLSATAIAVLVTPAFTWLEPVRAVGAIERLGTIGGALSIGGALLILLALARGARALARTRARMKTVAAGAIEIARTDSGVPVLITESPLPVMVLDGIVRPRLYVSRSVCDVLTPEEFDRAVAHELAHHAARDNAKRHLLAFAPDVVGESALARALAGQWQSEAELAADAAAAREGQAGALALASALVKVARLHAGRPPLDLGRAAFHDGRPIAARVQRLLSEGRSAPTASRLFEIVSISAAALALAAAATAPAVLTAVHQVTEWLVHLP